MSVVEAESRLGMCRCGVLQVGRQARQCWLRSHRRWCRLAAANTSRLASYSQRKCSTTAGMAHIGPNRPKSAHIGPANPVGTVEERETSQRGCQKCALYCCRGAFENEWFISCACTHIDASFFFAGMFLGRGRGLTVLMRLGKDIFLISGICRATSRRQAALSSS